jgi:hypothetical protein
MRDDLDPPADGPVGPRPAFSVVVPAHDEQAVVAGNLRAMTAGLLPGEADVVVVANGCTDATADEAARVPGVRVLVVPQASKTGALNAGDAATAVFPRVYVDADVRLTAQALRAVARALDTADAVVAGPRPRFDLARSTWPVRAFYAVFEQLPYVRDGLVGLGVYGLSAAGHQRLGAFPAVTADDLYVQRSFAPAERVVVDAEFVVSAPRTLAALLAVRRRVARGNRELARAHGLAASGGGTAAALLALLLRRPHLLPAVLVFAGVTARARASAARATGPVAWERDASTRAGAPA